MIIYIYIVMLTPPEPPQPSSHFLYDHGFLFFDEVEVTE